MKTIRSAFAAALFWTCTFPVHAADYAHFRGPNWRVDLQNWLNGISSGAVAHGKCDPATVTGGISGRGDVHVYCLSSGSGGGGSSGGAGTFTLLLYPRHPLDQANNTLKALVDGGIARIFAFVGEDVYVLTWTKQ
jgi:hypothetical protein